MATKRNRAAMGKKGNRRDQSAGGILAGEVERGRGIWRGSGAREGSSRARSGSDDGWRREVYSAAGRRRSKLGERDGPVARPGDGCPVATGVGGFFCKKRTVATPSRVGLYMP